MRNDVIIILSSLNSGRIIFMRMRNCLASALAALLFVVSGAFAGIKSEIHVAINAEPGTYDLARTTATVAYQMVAGNVFEKLVGIDEKFNVVPELAQNLEVNEDYTKYTYKLRRGVLFHNEQEMKADDVVASMNRWLESGMVKMAVGPASFKRIDDYTVSIDLASPLMTFNQLVGTMHPAPIIVPKSVIDRADAKSGVISEYIGTGPYMVDEIAPNDYLQLKAFDKYQPYGTKEVCSGWVGYKEAKTPTVIFHFVGDSSTRVAGIQFGEYDLAIQLPFDSYEEFDGNEEFSVYKESQGELAMVYNKRRGIASNKLFRQAVNAALNCEDVMRAAYVREEFYKLTSSYIEDAQNFWYTEAGKEHYNAADADKAKKLLADAGYSGEPFHLVVSSQYVEFYNAAIVVERALKDIGINVKLEVVDWPTYLLKAKDPKAYDAFITGFSEWAMPRLIGYLNPAWNGWSDDPYLASLMEKLTHDTDSTEAKKAWEEAQDFCWREYIPVSKLGNRYIYDVASTRMKGLIFFEGPHMWNVTVEE